MRLSVAAAALAYVLAGAAFAQNEPSEVRDSEVAKYKSTAANACREGGKKKGDPEDKVSAFCTCLMQHLEKSMSKVEWQQVYFYSHKNQPQDEQRILVPHLKTFHGCAAPEKPAAAPAAGSDAAAPAAPAPATGLKPPAAK